MFRRRKDTIIAWCVGNRISDDLNVVISDVKLMQSICRRTSPTFTLPAWCTSNIDRCDVAVGSRVVLNYVVDVDMGEAGLW